jgi:hypothetical protein
MSSKFHIVVPVLFDGRMMMSDALPRTYLIHYIFITTPIAILGLAATGIVAVVHRLVKGLDRRRAVIDWMLLVWLGLPLALFLALRPNAYDGLRHFLFVLPAIAVFAAVGVVSLIGLLPKGPPRLIFGFVIALLMVTPLLSIVRMHPYQIAYFNSLVGGAEGATGRYETEYWMTSYREAIQWIREQPAREDGAPVRVLVAANENSEWCAEYYAPANMQIETTLKGGQPGYVPQQYDYYLGTTRSLMSNNFPDAQVVMKVSRARAVFAVVKQNPTAHSE